MVVHTTPASCLQILSIAAKPSVKRLHLRNLFAYGRRYYIQPIEDGFRVVTTNKVRWHYRRRTSASAVLTGELTPIDETTTRITMHVRIRLFYMLGAFLIPTFMASILVFVPWQRWVIIVLLGTLYLLSWFERRYNAALEANEMVYFVEIALEDFVPSEMLALGGKSPDVVYDREDFSRAWERFYKEHKEK